MEHYSTDWIVGSLLGEVIWLSKLRPYTEYNILHNLCLQDERDEYNKLSDKQTQAYIEKRPSDELFKEYREYAHSLMHKYAPKEIIYRDWFHYKPENIDEFFDAVNTFLWNTDECTYEFTKEDIQFKETPFLPYLSITFKLCDFTK